jgi:hypothetical protein
MLMQRCENITKFGLLGQRYNTMEKQGCVITTYTDRFQQHTVGLALVGLEKGELFVLKKTIGFALTKADCFALKKSGVFVFKKTVFSP